MCCYSNQPFTPFFFNFYTLVSSQWTNYLRTAFTLLKHILKFDHCSHTINFSYFWLEQREKDQIARLNEENLKNITLNQKSFGNKLTFNSSSNSDNFLSSARFSCKVKLHHVISQFERQLYINALQPYQNGYYGFSYEGKLCHPSPYLTLKHKFYKW